MNLLTRSALIFLFALLPMAAAETTAPAATPAPQPPTGFWPTDRMVAGFISRAAAQLRNQYELTDRQTDQLEQQMTARWPEWLERNRRALQPVLNEMIEIRLSPEPPDPAYVADLADRVLPVFADFRDTLDQGNQQFRRILTPTQQTKFDTQRLAFAVAMDVAEQRLKRWQRGQFEPHELWSEPGQRRRRRRTETAPATQPQTRQAHPPLGNWQAYVESFVTRYRLSESQAQSARSILDEVRSRAEKSRDSTAEQLKAVERHLEDASPQNREQLQQQRRILLRPIAKLFDELKQRLDSLLTAAQRGQPTTNPAGS